MERIAVITDSNSGISQEMAKEYGIHILPLIFHVGGQEYAEGVSLTEERFFGALEEGEEVSTSQPSIADLMELWDGLLEKYDKVLHIPMTRALSGSYDTAAGLSQEYEGRVLVVDGRRISATLENMVLHAAKLVGEGMRAEDIQEHLEKIALDASIYITVDSLRYLKKGGRISGVEAMAGEILNIRPVIQIKGGLLEVHSKVRGRKKAKASMEELLMEDWKRLAGVYGEERLHLAVGHANALKEATEWKEELKKHFPGKEIKLVKLPMSICCHVGPGTIGVAVDAD